MEENIYYLYLFFYCIVYLGPNERTGSGQDEQYPPGLLNTIFIVCLHGRTGFVVLLDCTVLLFSLRAILEGELLLKVKYNIIYFFPEKLNQFEVPLYFDYRINIEYKIFLI